MFTHKKTIFICFVTIVHIIIALSILPYIINEYRSKTRVYDSFQTSTIISSLIGITQRKDDYPDGIMEYCGSGVIISRIANRYYALTAAHVINDLTTEYRALTGITDYEQTQNSNNLGGKIKSRIKEMFNVMPLITIEYVSQNSDLAIVSFQSTNELSIIDCGTSSNNKGSKIVCLSRLNDRIMETYGTITSGQKAVAMMDYQTNTRITDLVYEHNAYLIPGSSGGPVLSEDLELIGINNGGTFSLFGHFINGYFIPNEQIRKCIMEWQNTFLFD